jgi:hypothetical protein
MRFQCLYEEVRIQSDLIWMNQVEE